MRISRRLTFAAYLVVTIAMMSEAQAGFMVTDFTNITNAAFTDLPATDTSTVISIDGVNITSNEHIYTGSFSSFTPGGPNDPGGGQGYLISNASFVGRP